MTWTKQLRPKQRCASTTSPSALPQQRLFNPSQPTCCLLDPPVMQATTARSALTCFVSFVRGKFSPRQGRGNNLSPKHAPRNYYKGNGCPSLGNITKKGKFIVDLDKVPRLMVPNIAISKIKPYVTYATDKPVADKPSS